MHGVYFVCVSSAFGPSHIIACTKWSSIRLSSLNSELPSTPLPFVLTVLFSTSLSPRIQGYPTRSTFLPKLICFRRHPPCGPQSHQNCYWTDNKAIISCHCKCFPYICLYRWGPMFSWGNQCTLAVNGFKESYQWLQWGHFPIFVCTGEIPFLGDCTFAMKRILPTRKKYIYSVLVPLSSVSNLKNSYGTKCEKSIPWVLVVLWASQQVSTLIRKAATASKEFFEMRECLFMKSYVHRFSMWV